MTEYDKPKIGFISANPKEDVMECPKHKLPATPDKSMIYQCDECREETKLINEAHKND